MDAGRLAFERVDDRRVVQQHDSRGQCETRRSPRPIAAPPRSSRRRPRGAAARRSRGSTSRGSRRRSPSCRRRRARSLHLAHAPTRGRALARRRAGASRRSPRAAAGGGRDCRAPRTTGTSSGRQTSARTSASAGSPSAVRSPASMITSASTAARSNAREAAARGRPLRGYRLLLRSSATASPLLLPPLGLRQRVDGYRASMARRNVDVEPLVAAMKHAGAALRDAEIRFALAGGLAIWARGGRGHRSRRRLPRQARGRRARAAGA